MSAAVNAPRPIGIGPGVTLHYQEAGQGAPLVLIHGLTGDLGSWGGQMPVFAQTYRTISYSRRFSRPNRNDLSASPGHSVWVEADDLAGLLDALDASPAILVGSSFGAYVALALAMTHPEKVRALVLSEPPVFDWADQVPGGAALRERYVQDVLVPSRAAFDRGDDRAAQMIYARFVMGQDALDQLPDAVRERRFSNVDPIKALALSRHENLPLNVAALAQIKAPTLFMSGAQTQPLFAAVFQAAQTLMPQAQFHQVADSGHSVYREQTDVFNALTLAFLARHGPASCHGLKMG
ncbi:MAG: 2-hydroxy-6-oxononadienedioate/2-hydroxy-6-oxononatrienedioate hydrolase [Pseudomonadota bacterium]